MLEYRESCGHIKDGWCIYCIELWKEAYEKGKRDMLVNKIGFMCRTDYEYELENATGGVDIYSSVNDLKNHKKCWEDCGIVKVEITFKEELKNDKASDSN